MRIVFLGTPEFAVPTLKALIKAGHEVLGVFTQPDRPSGRGKQTKASPVKVAAEELGLKIYQPEKIKDPNSVALLRELSPDCIIVVAYGQILSKEILELPPKGCINVHASLLPNYRGAAPIHWSVINGEAVTGVTTMLMDEGLDTGDMLLKKEYQVNVNSTTGEVHDALAVLGADLLIETLGKWENNKIKPIPQLGPSSYASLLKREHEEINWSSSQRKIHNQIRGLNPWPGAYTLFRGEIVKLWRSSLECLDGMNLEDNRISVFKQPGEILNVNDEGILVATGDKPLLVTLVQPAGKRAMPARDFFNGRHGKLGEYFG